MAYADGVAAQARRGVLRSLSLSVLTSRKETAAKVLEDGAECAAEAGYSVWGCVVCWTSVHSSICFIHLEIVHGRSRDLTMLARYHSAKVGFIPHNSVADNGERTAEKAAAAAACDRR